MLVASNDDPSTINIIGNEKLTTTGDLNLVNDAAFKTKEDSNYIMNSNGNINSSASNKLQKVKLVLVRVSRTR